MGCPYCAHCRQFAGLRRSLEARVLSRWFLRLSKMLPFASDTNRHLALLPPHGKEIVVLHAFGAELGDIATSLRLKRQRVYDIHSDVRQILGLRSSAPALLVFVRACWAGVYTTDEILKVLRLFPKFRRQFKGLWGEDETFREPFPGRRQ